MNSCSRPNQISSSSLPSKDLAAAKNQGVCQNALHLHASPSTDVQISKLTNSPSIGRQRLSRGSISITHNQNIIHAISSGAEGILENPARPQNDLGVVSGSLIRRAPIKVPAGQVLYGLGPLDGECAGFGAAVSGSVDPDVFGEDLVLGVGEGVEAVDDCGV